MRILVEVVLVLILLLVVIQDFKYRAISWFTIPILVSLLIFRQLEFNKVSDILWNAFVCFCFVLIQYCVLTIYFSLKHKSFVNIIDSYIGLGDILFFMVLCFAFSPLLFFSFYFVSIFLILISYLLFRLFKINVDKEIPLAGLQSAFLIGVILISNIVGKFSFYDDYYFLTCFIG